VKTYQGQGAGLTDKADFDTPVSHHVMIYHSVTN
jgi:hypothetical protein